MANPELTLFSYEILGLVGREGAGPHDLRRMTRAGRLLAWAGESQYYVEPKRLARLGYLDAHKEPGKTRERTVYTLTEKGRQALAEYAATPVSVLPIKSDALLRLLVCDLVGDQVTLESLATLRTDVADLRERVADARATATQLPHRTRYLLIVTDFLERFLDLHDQLVDDVQHELAQGGRPASAVGADPKAGTHRNGAR
jgi:DNA-binding PadR family transcriptional regulator